MNMEMINYIKPVLLASIRQPEGSRCDYLDMHRNRIGYSKKGFIVLLREALKEWDAFILSSTANILANDFDDFERLINEYKEKGYTPEMKNASGNTFAFEVEAGADIDHGWEDTFITQPDLIRMEDLIGRYQVHNEEITATDIWRKYWDKREGGLREDLAYQEIKEWLLMHFTTKEIKDRFNFKLEKDAFVRLARNNR